MRIRFDVCTVVELGRMCADVGPWFAYKLSKQLDAHLRYRFGLVDYNNEIIDVENHIANHLKNNFENLVNDRNRIYDLRDVYDFNNIVRKSRQQRNRLCCR
ncbi:unnamed protein product [Clonostachys rosea]|uniref:Uncharacterized protein n=1 Tax=Bionectria ochroleuca TaxID=29856 RepID=A0ABY6UUU4_BIOOC|nr:unnamed protein product [Clonostachys rosea]